MNRYFWISAIAVLLLAMPPVAKGDSVTSIGNTASLFANGSTQTTVAVTTAETGPAPFSGICGGGDITSNCSTSWTFSNLALPSNETITGATLTLGIWDIDSKAAGNQVATYAITGGEDLTASLNSAAEALNGNTGSKNSEYDIFTLALTSFGGLAAGGTSVTLTLQGPGLGVIGPTTFNAAGLVFSTLDIQTTTKVSAVPEPSVLQLLLAGIASIVLLRLGVKRVVRS